MWSQQNTQKVQATHLARQAFIYIRQSSLRQVKHNIGSTARQYDLAQRAVDMGWSPAQIVVIDQDQARSGASAVGRQGFQFLVAEVGLGHAGAVLSLEASRLARSSSDWYRLIEICALTNTLVIDEEGVYDPGEYNDRLLLGFKGTLSEAELHWIRARMDGGKWEKARQGKLRFHPPTGFVYDAAHQFIFDPDEQVQAAIRLVFDLFEEVGTARGVAHYFYQQQLRIPTRIWGSARAGELVWRPLNASRVYEMLHNPLYAGAYVYGRTERQSYLPSPTATMTKTRQVKQADWPVVIHDAHPAYITWEQFLRNQQQLTRNQILSPSTNPGPVREGAGLLQGIVICGQCGRRMTTCYQEDGVRPVYQCDATFRRLGGSRCQTLRGQRIDAAVTRALLTAIQPAQLELSIATLEQVEKRQSQIERQWQLRLERAQYESDLARRRLLAVEPENRLVARTLEKEWNEKLEAVAAVEKAYAKARAAIPHLATAAERKQVLALAKDLPAVWQASTTTHAQRKRLLRFLIKDVTLTGHETTIHIGIRWQTEAVTVLTVPRATKRTASCIITRIRELAETHHADGEIAALLNQAGWTTSRCFPFTASRVKELRNLYSIAAGYSKRPDDYPTGQRPDGRYHTRAVAQILNRPLSTISQWCHQGRFDAVQDKPNSPYWIRLTAADIDRYRKDDDQTT